MKNIFEYGVAEGNQAYENQSIKISNKVAIIFVGIGVVYIVFSLVYAPALSIVPVFLMLGSAVVLILNSYNIKDFPRFFLTVVICTCVAFYNALPLPKEEPLMLHFYIGQFAVTLLPWAFIDVRETYLLITSLIYSYLLFITLPWLNSNFHLDIENGWLKNDFMVYTTYASSIVASVFSLHLLQSRFINADRHAKVISGNIENKIAEMENRQSELQKRIDEVNEAYKEEEKRNWIATGLSKMTNLLRQFKSDEVFPELAEAITKYLEVAQGAIYLVKEDEEYQSKYIELEGCYAFDRKKYFNKKVYFGDGLLGQSCLEQEIIKIDEVPDSYVEITSGLGDAPPKCLIIVPMIYDEKVMGVLEMLAYKPFKDNEVEFLKQMGENLASFISNSLTNLKTRELLEQSQQQAEEMRAQEEEMRQNMEELQATQEEMTRKEKEYLQKIETLEARVKEKHHNVH